MTDFNPDNRNHKKLLSEVRKIFEDEERVKTPALIDEIHPFEPPEGDAWSKGYLRTMLGKVRQYMKDEGEIRVEEERTQNQPTKIWVRK